MGRNAELLDQMTLASIEKRWDDFGTFVTDDVTAWSPSYDVAGRAAWVDTIRQQNEPLEDIRVDQKVLSEADSLVVTEWVWSCRDASGTGRFALHGISAWEFEAGLVSGIRQYWDTGEIAQQLGDAAPEE
jgi:ketosteroid isomerase-like protein